MKSTETTRRTLHLLERRTFLALASGGLLAAPLAAEGQQAGKVYTLGILSPHPSPSSEQVVEVPLWTDSESSVGSRVRTSRSSARMATEEKIACRRSPKSSS